MTDEDYIKQAIELADGWSISEGRFFVPPFFNLSTEQLQQSDLDALAAQLVRQVDALGYVEILIFACGTEVRLSGQEHVARIASGRTMNTIKAIVDSGVLK